MTTVSDSKERFSFGKNWKNFLQYLNEERIVEAEKSLQEKLSCQNLKGKTFLDIGSGSGLFSLAAYRLGATVHSFDYDIESVNCTKYLKNKYAPDTNSWSVEQGSVLDEDFLNKFQQVDVVYSWGVLHHTGNMYQAFENVSKLVKDGGYIFISIYNDQGKASKVWKKIKKLYVSLPWLRGVLVVVCGVWIWKYRIAYGLMRYGNPLKYIIEHSKNNRGMSAWHDVIDWVGGYPFEVAKPEQVFDFFKEKGLYLDKIKTCAGGLGCNEFVLIKK
jgi:SAM-dependent methyltransferase